MGEEKSWNEKAWNPRINFETKNNFRKGFFRGLMVYERHLRKRLEERIEELEETSAEHTVPDSYAYDTAAIELENLLSEINGGEVRSDGH